MTVFTRSRRARSAVAMAVSALALVGALVASPLAGLQGVPSASAELLEGPGFRIPHDFRLSMVGAYRAPDGSLAYCLEWGQESPTLPSDPAQQSVVVTQYAGWSSEEVARVNWLIGTHGQQVSDEQAAAVGVAIWLRHPGDTADKFRIDHPFFIAAIPDSTLRGRVVAEAQRLSALMDGYRYVAPAAAGVLEIVPDAADAMRGEVSITGLPAGAAGELSLLGAQLGDGTAPAPSRFSGDMRLPYRLTPSDAEIGKAEVSAFAELSLPGGSAGPALRVWQSAPELQDVAAVGPVELDFAWQLRASAEHSIVFSPQLTTQVPSKIIAEGEALADTLKLSLASGSAPWRTFSDGSTLPVTVVCRAYGPFATPPIEASDVPADAPLATEAVRVQVGGDVADPIAEAVPVEYALIPAGGGYYTSVCGIDAAEQDEPTSAAGMPLGYRFADTFGLAEETQFSPIGVRFETTLSDAQVHPGATVVDVIVGEATGGPWAQWRGEPVAVALVGTVYWSESRPTRAEVPPPGVEVVQTLRSGLVEPGRRAEAVIELPERAGWYTVRWCTDPAGSVGDDSVPLVRLWCDDYAVPSETVHAVAASSPPRTPSPAGLASTGSVSAAGPWWAGWLALLGGVLTISLGASSTLRARSAQRRSAGAFDCEQ